MMKVAEDLKVGKLNVNRECLARVRRILFLEPWLL